jgi:molybdopterin/thiamine biosynthesis adenylyltransferase
MTTTTLSAAEQIAQRLDTSLVTEGRVLVIGLGGIGLHLARALATFLAGLCHALDALTIEFRLYDGDAYHEENAYRVDAPGLGNKAALLASELLARHACPNFAVRPVPEYVTPANVAGLIQEHDCVFLACDNHATRHLVGRHCAGLLNITLISGGNDGVDEQLRGTYGNVQVHVRRRGQDLTAPLDRFHPEIATPQDQSPHELSCLDMVTAGVPQILFVNLAVASAMCNVLLRLMMREMEQPIYDEVGLDIADAVSTPHWLS